MAPDFCGTLKKGTPVAQCFAVPREAPQLVFESFDDAHKAAYTKTVSEVLATPGVYRKHFRARRGRLSSEHDPEKWTPVFGEDHAQTKK
jgi:hypothetical protein